MTGSHTLDVELPGRLGDPTMELRSDPRADPRMVAALAPFGLDARAAELPVTRQSPVEDLLAVAAATEQGFDGLFGALLADVPDASGVEMRNLTIAGIDGNAIDLFVHRPIGAAGPLPGLLHLHGGGMTILTAADRGAMLWRNHLAAQGCLVVGVEFRNAGGALGPHPFPAGLNDCASALHWMHTQREGLGVTSIVVTGESGGGNLSLATALKAMRDGRADHVDGVYAQVPFIFGGYDAPDPALASLVENEGYILSPSVMTLMATLYDPTGEHARDPLAWPYHAGVDELRGLPPHVVTTDEVDPLRDEGLAYLRKLQRAGVDATGHTYAGVGHACEQLMGAAVPDLFERALRDVADFARRVA
ncbi:alpha/beta hydrolase fold domain-containing protein [Mycolicibacterium sp. 050158]|uniref:alpha/beta hydrolase fold domain-containing protein n=1 Tax=Mycolicibacterium sp. 050158 TaxID=3090602 RepID=UPI00299E233A|nr:alpha/beta hydrolase fold domain-containing protein [Mycolicibacterium sp. 050158]MDX1892953.1 alpha/beta hydrolase fold domain-containing protein [Mycolicibacterium sp. 050158]